MTAMTVHPSTGSYRHMYTHTVTYKDKKTVGQHIQLNSVTLLRGHDNVGGLNSTTGKHHNLKCETNTHRHDNKI